jgi:hypothetical protein
MKQHQVFNSLRRLRDELVAGKFAVGHLIRIWDADSSLPIAAAESDVTHAELRRFADNLEFTFIIRLFSEFEAALREYWQNGLRRSTTPPIYDLMESVGRRIGINSVDLFVAHEVREFRNKIVHESHRDAGLDFADCLGNLGRFLRWLPSRW